MIQLTVITLNGFATSCTLMHYSIFHNKKGSRHKIQSTTSILSLLLTAGGGGLLPLHYGAVHNFDCGQSFKLIHYFSCELGQTLAKISLLNAKTNKKKK